MVVVTGFHSARWLLYFAVWAVGCALGCGAVPADETFRGVALVHQGDWPEDVWKAFRETPWLDAASVRIKWSELEPRDQGFDWGPFDRVIEGVRKYNADHPGENRKVHLRPLGGVHGPEWFEGAGVRFYDTEQRSHVYHRERPATGKVTPIRPPMPYDNPEFLKQLRELYRAMRKSNPGIRAILSSGYSIDGEAQSILDDGVLDSRLAAFFQDLGHDFGRKNEKCQICGFREIARMRVCRKAHDFLLPGVHGIDPPFIPQSQQLRQLHGSHAHRVARCTPE